MHFSPKQAMDAFWAHTCMIVSPIVLGMIFFGLFTPIAMLAS